MVSTTTKRAVFLLAVLFVAAVLAGYVGIAVYSALSGGTPPLVLLAAVTMALSLLVTVVGIGWRRRQ